MCVAASCHIGVLSVNTKHTHTNKRKILSLKCYSPPKLRPEKHILQKMRD